MENEKLILCDCKFYQNDKGQTFFYLLICSNTYEYLERVYVTKEDFEFVVKNKLNIKIEDFLQRTYNRTKQHFVLRFRRK